MSSTENMFARIYTRLYVYDKLTTQIFLENLQEPKLDIFKS